MLNTFRFDSRGRWGRLGSQCGGRVSQGTPPLRVSRLEGSAVGIKEPLAREGFPQVEEVALLQCGGRVSRHKGGSAPFRVSRQTAPAVNWRDSREACG